MLNRIAQFSILSILLTSGVFGQGRGPIPIGGGWTTARGDAQRSGWEHSNGYISVESLQKDSLQKPGFSLQWKRKLENAPRQNNVLTQASSAPGSGLNPPPTIIGGSSNNVFALDEEAGNIAWTHHFDGALPAATAACPGGLTAGVTRNTTLDQVVSSGISRAPGRGRGPFMGAVGKPGEGVPMEMMQGGMFGPGGGGPGGGRGASGRGPGGGPGGFGGPGGASGRGPGGFGGPGGMAQGIYVLAADGTLHTLGQVMGKDIQRPLNFLPANANATDLIAINQVVYTVTTNDCGGVPNGVWARDLADQSKAAISWKNAASPAGSPAFSSNGTLYVAIGDGPTTGGGYADAVVALDPKTLQVKDCFTAAGASFSSTPVIFKYKDHELLAAATKDGRLFLLDCAALGGADHKTALYSSAALSTVKAFNPTALATWEDATQTRWLLIPAAGAKSNVIAFKMTGDPSKPTLQQGWTSGDMTSPAPPIIVNGVVFALSSGDKKTNAVLYAIDGMTGKELWNSGKTIASYVSSGGLWASDGQVYVPTYDSTVYAFGFAMERHL